MKAAPVNVTLARLLILELLAENKADALPS